MSHPRRVFVDFPADSRPTYGYETTLSNKDSHHLRDVLRMAEGAALTVIDRATAQEYEAIICAVDECLTVRLLAKRDRRASTSRVKTLIFALAKGKNTEFVCEKACELGVQNILLWQSDRSVVRIEGEREREKKLQRWKSILESAGKQSGNDYVPSLTLALNMKELLERFAALRAPQDRAFICSLSPESKSLQHTPAPTEALHIAVGPEGDFTEQEERTLVEQGFERLSLGPLVLRCETAAIVAISMVHGAWGFLSDEN